MTIISTAGAANANSYIDLADAETYFSSRMDSDKWTSATEETKEGALVQSAILLDSVFDWSGERVTEEQSLRWPRSYAPDLDGYDYPDDEIPTNLKHAQCELAVYLIANNGYTAETRDVDRLRLGSIMLDFDNAAAALPIPNIVVDLLRGLGVYRGAGKSGSNLNVPLVRV